MKSGKHRVSNSTIQLMKVYMDGIIKLFIANNGIDTTDPIEYLLKSKKKEIYLQKLEALFEIYSSICKLQKSQTINEYFIKKDEK